MMLQSDMEKLDFIFGLLLQRYNSFVIVGARIDLNKSGWLQLLTITIIGIIPLIIWWAEGSKIILTVNQLN